eukprot:TRINITY_DN3710_c0_g1_i5.p2 TRINITY_DN3710_c0_g1~~TRINITY_DN3710_c0_g1_i5.p2  ORF type:complete len:106 (-),score=19.58 TRINITY_DN3710_c0_g1_i5:94-411(-)
MIRRPPRSTHCISSAASDVYKRQMIYYDFYVLMFGLMILSLAGNGIQQPPDCSSTFLVSTQLAERQQLAKQLQGGVHGFGIKFDPMYSALIPCLLYTSPSPRDQA